jgi:hypothetical protein
MRPSFGISLNLHPQFLSCYLTFSSHHHGKYRAENVPFLFSFSGSRGIDCLEMAIQKPSPLEHVKTLKTRPRLDSVRTFGCGSLVKGLSQNGFRNMAYVNNATN